MQNYLSMPTGCHYTLKAKFLHCVMTASYVRHCE